MKIIFKIGLLILESFDGYLDERITQKPWIMPMSTEANSIWNTTTILAFVRSIFGHVFRQNIVKVAVGPRGDSWVEP